jgi:succinate dehydrogenase hydrophobic anchor subunit
MRQKPRNAAEAYANRRHNAWWSVLALVIVIVILVHL